MIYGSFNKMDFRQFGFFYPLFSTGTLYQKRFPQPFDAKGMISSVYNCFLVVIWLSPASFYRLLLLAFITQSICLRNSWALAATITVLKLMKIAPMAGLISRPGINPVANGIATAL